jgi:hypothetical protein
MSKRAGNVVALPGPVADEFHQLLPNNEFIREWKSGAALDAARGRVKEFLAKHTPPRA